MSLSAARCKKTIGVALATGLAASMLAFAGTTAPSQAADSTASADTSGRTLSIGSYNIQMRRPMEDFRAGVTFIMSKAEVFGLQEAGGNGGARRAFLDGIEGWGLYRASHMRQTPILWNTDEFKRVKAYERKISDAARIDKAGGGTEPFKAQYVPVVRLKPTYGGHAFTVINVHLIHGAVNAGRPRKGSPNTYRVYRRQVRALRALVKAERSSGRQVFVTGDYNIGYAADRKVRNRKLPYRRLSSINMKANWAGKPLNNYGTHIDPSCPKGKTHCGAYIDQIWAPSKAATSTVYTDEVYSDHYPIMSTYHLAS
jgi:endonuclease/exonuclease/phosphatase family metal-dependent hydrolase